MTILHDIQHFHVICATCSLQMLPCLPCRRERDTLRIAQALYAAAIDADETSEYASKLQRDSEEQLELNEDKIQPATRQDQKLPESKPDASSASVVADIPTFDPPPALPFELRALEALLAETVRQFERRRQRLALLADTAEEEINRSLRTNAGDMQRLLPVQRCVDPACGLHMVHGAKPKTAIANLVGSAQFIAFARTSACQGICWVWSCLISGLQSRCAPLQKRLCCPVSRALTEMQHDVRETQEALQECMDNPATLSGICLTEAQEPQSQVVHSLHCPAWCPRWQPDLIHTA